MFDLFDQLEALDRPMVHPKPWMTQKRLVRATTEMLPSIVDQCIHTGLYAIDLETSGLDNRVFNNRTRDYIVGCCISPDGETGYYIPVRHIDHMHVCVPVSIFESEMRRLFASNAVAIFHNAKFDQEFFQFPGGEPMSEFDDPKKWEDTLILAYLRDTHAKNKGLKHLSKTLLDMEMIELEDLFTKEQLNEHGHNFGVLDPTWEPSVWYGASDAICTYLLYKRIKDDALNAFEGRSGQRLPVGSGGTYVPSQDTIYVIEKLDINAVRWMERCRVPIDRVKVADLIRIGQREWLPSLMDVYTEANKALGRDIMPGYVQLLADPNSPHFFDTELVGLSPDVQGSDGLDTTLMGRIHSARLTAEKKNMDPVVVNAGKKTRFQTMPKSVPKLTDPNHTETVEFPVVYDILIPDQLGLLLRELGVENLAVTDKSGQIKTSKEELDKAIEAAGERFPFIKKIKRFREVAKALASNLQPIYDDTHPERSPDSTIRVNFEPLKTDTGRFSTPQPREGNGFTGTVRWNLQSIPAAYDQSKPECMLRLREVIAAPPEHVVLSADFSGEELRLATNFSGELKWVNEFFRCSECDYQFERGGLVPPPPEPPPPFCPSCGSDKIGDLHSLTALSIFGDGIKEDKKEYKAKRQLSKCVHPDTLIIRDGSLCRIGNLPFGNDDEFRPVGGTIQGLSGPIPLLESYNGGVKPLYHVVTTRGIVTCSDQHPFLTQNGLRSISEGLGEGDMLVDPAPVQVGDQPYPCLEINLHADVPSLQYTPSHAMSYAAGVYQGDGYKAGDRSVGVCHGSIKKRDQMGVAYDQWQMTLANAMEQAGFRPQLKDELIYLGSRNTIRFMECLGLVTFNGSRRFRVPEWIMSAGRTAILHYLAGLWDTDGSVSPKDGSGKWCTKDIVFAGQVAALMASVGITPRIDVSWNTTYKRYYWLVTALSIGMSAIGEYMLHPGKKQRIHSRAKANLSRGAKVKLIVPAGDMQCYDVHVDSEDHVFWCNGIATRNSLNFAMSYGGGGSAAQRAIGCSKDEGWRIKHQFDKAYKTLAAWWKKMHEYARATGLVLTAYNRRIYLPDINHPDGNWRSKAERNATNGPIQGSGSDIMKLAMGMLYKEFKRRGWLDKVKMIITIHDELVFIIPYTLLAEAIPVIKEIMIRKTIAKMPWRVPLTTDIEAGPDYTVPWNLTHIEWGKAEMPPELAPYLSHLVKVPYVPKDKSKAPTEAVPANPEPIYTLRIPEDFLSEDVLAYLAELIGKLSGGLQKSEIRVAETDEVIWEGYLTDVKEFERLLHDDSN